MMFGDEEAGEADPTSGPEQPTRRPKGSVVVHAGHEAKSSPPAVSHPPVYRGVIAGWPQGWRERWGRRANDLEDAGLSWRDAEARAFVEVWSQLRQERGEVRAPEPQT